MPMRKSETPMDKELAELERELREVRRTMKSAARQRPGDRQPGPGRAAAVYSPPPSAPSPGPTEPADARHGELFAHANRAPGGWRTGDGRSTDEKRQFAHYFASGSFVGGMRPPREMHRLKRNKAIFMVIVVLVVGFILYSIFFR